MANINLLTIHWGCSYGAVLQTFSTIKILESLGHKVTLINLVPESKQSTIWSGISLKKRVHDFGFSLFKFLYLRPRTKSLNFVSIDNIPQADYYVVGSDQVWNYDITRNLLGNFLLDFVKGSRKISFASSFGKNSIKGDVDLANFYKDRLIQFDAISVRENSGVEICKELLNKDVERVLDPTLVWNNFDELVSTHHYNYIYPFLLVDNTTTKEICEFISKELRIPLYKKTKIREFFCNSPWHWLRRIKNSRFIITDSFHGLAFSIIFHKKFIVLCANKNKFTRLESLLRLLRLEERYVKSLEDIKTRSFLLVKEINYESVDSILQGERKKSIDFLTSNIY